MAENTGISWTNHTANPWWGCTEVHAGCDNCYARLLAARWGFEVWGAKGVRRFIKGFWKDLNMYQRKAAAAGVVRSVFIGSMMDIFEKSMLMVDNDGKLVTIRGNNDSWDMETGHIRNDIFYKISQGLYPNLLFLFLTKRPSNINKFIPEAWRVNGAPENVMFGTSVVDQPTADKHIPELLKVKGRLFLSMEPLLGEVDLQLDEKWCDKEMHDFDEECTVKADLIEWIIVGGESTAKARPMHPTWAKSLRDQAIAAGVKFHFKQWGEWFPYRSMNINTPISKKRIEYVGDDKEPMIRLGKEAAGRLLGDLEYNATPLTA